MARAGSSVAFGPITEREYRPSLSPGVLSSEGLTVPELNEGL